jgi:hypothetical protein
VFSLSNAYHLIGFGLSEISSAGLLCMAAHCAIRSRNGSVRAAMAAGVLATLAFYTRLNNLPMALGVAVFALPIGLPAGALVRPAAWLRRVSFTTLLVGPAIGLGVLLLAWRVWYYTGVFSILHGTQFERLALWQPGMPIRTVVVRMLESVMMVLSVNDPPRFDFAALPVLLGALAAVAAAVQWLRPSLPVSHPVRVRGTTHARPLSAAIADFHPEQIVSVLPPDRIRALDNPTMIPAERAPLRDREKVIGVVVRGHARAYPLGVLAAHEIVNDEVAGKPFAVTW